MEQVLISEDERQIIEGAVRAGAAELDKSGTDNWRQLLFCRQGEIDVSSVENCPLAIIFGGYSEGLLILGLAQGGTHGFCYPAGLARTPGVDLGAWLAAVYAAMADAWRREAAQSLTPVR